MTHCDLNEISLSLSLRFLSSQWFTSLSSPQFFFMCVTPSLTQNVRVNLLPTTLDPEKSEGRSEHVAITSKWVDWHNNHKNLLTHDEKEEERTHTNLRCWWSRRCLSDFCSLSLSPDTRKTPDEFSFYFLICMKMFKQLFFCCIISRRPSSSARSKRDHSTFENYKISLTIFSFYIQRRNVMRMRNVFRLLLGASARRCCPLNCLNLCDSFAAFATPHVARELTLKQKHTQSWESWLMCCGECMWRVFPNVNVDTAHTIREELSTQSSHTRDVSIW